MSLVLGRGHAAAAHLKHVRIVPTARPGDKGRLAVVTKLGSHARKRIADVTRGAPQIAQTRSPGIERPGAYTERDWPPRFHQGVAHVEVIRLSDALMKSGRPI